VIDIFEPEGIHQLIRHNPQLNNSTAGNLPDIAEYTRSRPAINGPWLEYIPTVTTLPDDEPMMKVPKGKKHFLKGLNIVKTGRVFLD
jgi:hypothetical protein